MTYINVVHGASRNPMNGTQKEEKVTSKRRESNNHHNTIAERGPKKSKTTKTHMTKSSRSYSAPVNSRHQRNQYLRGSAVATSPAPGEQDPTGESSPLFDNGI